MEKWASTFQSIMPVFKQSTSKHSLLLKTNLTNNNLKNVEGISVQPRNNNNSNIIELPHLQNEQLTKQTLKSSQTDEMQQIAFNTNATLSNQLQGEYVPSHLLSLSPQNCSSSTDFASVNASLASLNSSYSVNETILPFSAPEVSPANNNIADALNNNLLLQQQNLQRMQVIDEPIMNNIINENNVNILPQYDTDLNALSPFLQSQSLNMQSQSPVSAQTAIVTQVQPIIFEQPGDYSTLPDTSVIPEATVPFSPQNSDAYSLPFINNTPETIQVLPNMSNPCTLSQPPLLPQYTSNLPVIPQNLPFFVPPVNLLTPLPSRGRRSGRKSRGQSRMLSLPQSNSQLLNRNYPVKLPNKASSSPYVSLSPPAPFLPPISQSDSDEQTAENVANVTHLQPFPSGKTFLPLNTKEIESPYASHPSTYPSHLSKLSSSEKTSNLSSVSVSVPDSDSHSDSTSDSNSNSNSLPPVSVSESESVQQILPSSSSKREQNLNILAETQTNSGFNTR